MTSSDTFSFGMLGLIEKEDFVLLVTHTLSIPKTDGGHHPEVFFGPEAHTLRSILNETIAPEPNKLSSKAGSGMRISTHLNLYI